MIPIPFNGIPFNQSIVDKIKPNDILLWRLKNGNETPITYSIVHSVRLDDDFILFNLYDIYVFKQYPTDENNSYQFVESSMQYHFGMQRFSFNDKEYNLFLIEPSDKEYTEYWKVRILMSSFFDGKEGGGEHS